MSSALIWFEKCLTTKMGVYRTIVRVEIYLFSVSFIQKNLGERDQKEIKSHHTQKFNLACRASQVFLAIS